MFSVSFVSWYILGWDSFLCISKDVYELVVHLFYAKLYWPDVPKGTEPILWSYIPNVPIEFSVSSLLNMLNLPNKANMFFLPLPTSLLCFLKQSLMFLKKFWFIIPSVKPPNSNNHLNNFIDNIVPRADYKDFLHPLQAIFMYALIINWRLNLGLIFFEKLRTLIRGMSDPNRAIQTLSSLWDDSHCNI